MLIEVPQKAANKIVVKRDGKKVEFDGAKIALAIQKGFGDIIGMQDPKTAKYNETDVNKVYSKVLSRIAKLEKDKIKIEEIQDLIEEELKNNGYTDVYSAFSSYREKRNQSRQLFFDEKKQHKFLKGLENLGLQSYQIGEAKKEEGANSMSTMLQYGSAISRQFAITYLMKNKFSEAHENGDIYIHDMDFIPMGTTSSCEIDLNKLYTDGFSAGYGYVREPNDIRSYVNLATVAIQANQNDQHGEQSIPAFDYYMAPGVLKTFKKQFKQIVFDYLEFTNFDKFIAMNGIEREMEKVNTIDFDIKIFDKYSRDAKEIQKIFRTAYEKALEKTNHITYQAMEAFIHSLNTMSARTKTKKPYTSINFGTDTSPEGRMIIKNFLEATLAGLGNHDTAMFPISIFKVKKGVNSKEKDPNYDLLELACEVSKKRGFPYFSFLDAPFNEEFYKQGDYDTEVAYMGSNVRIIENMVDTNKSVTTGRGALSTTTINLPRIAIKHGIVYNKKADLEKFFHELEEKMDLVKDQLLERFEIQCKKKTFGFPFLIEQGLWLDSEKLKSTDNLKKVLKHGTLNIGFIGLAECLKALTGSHHGEDEKSQKLGLKIIENMRKKCDEYSEKYNLNFCLIGISSEKLCAKFTKLDQAIYGKLKGITDQEYTTSFHIPQKYSIVAKKKIELEAPYHAFTNGGHITYVQAKSDSNYMKIIQDMEHEEIGYGAIIPAKENG